MRAKKIFERMGYRQIRNDDDYVIYEKEIDDGNNKKIVSFCSQLESVHIEYEVKLNTPGFDMELFQAVAAQLLELRWIEFRTDIKYQKA